MDISQLRKCFSIEIFYAIIWSKWLAG